MPWSLRNRRRPARFRKEFGSLWAQALGAKLTPDKVEATLTQLANTTANVDTGTGRPLSSRDLVDSTYRGRDVTYEYAAKSTGNKGGNKVSGRYRVIITTWRPYDGPGPS